MPHYWLILRGNMISGLEQFMLCISSSEHSGIRRFFRGALVLLTQIRSSVLLLTFQLSKQRLFLMQNNEAY